MTSSLPLVSIHPSSQSASEILAQDEKIQELEKKIHRMFVRKIKIRGLETNSRKSNAEQDEKMRELENHMKKNKAEQDKKIQELERNKTEQAEKIRKLDIDMKKIKAEKANKIRKLESGMKKNKARIIDLENELWGKNCEREEC